jgi:hypothetical protein
MSETPQETQVPLFWAEGTLDAVALGGGGKPLRFRLVPSDNGLVEIKSKKYMLFKKDAPGKKAASSGGTDGNASTEPEKGDETSGQGDVAEPEAIDAKLVACEKSQRPGGKEGVWFVPVLLCPCFSMELLLEAKTARGVIRVGLPWKTSANGTWEHPFTATSLVFL